MALSSCAAQPGCGCQTATKLPEEAFACPPAPLGLRVGCLVRESSGHVPGRVDWQSNLTVCTSPQNGEREGNRMRSCYPREWKTMVLLLLYGEAHEHNRLARRLLSRETH